MNGIFNGDIKNPEAAQNLAHQNAQADYLIRAPEASNFFAELLVAGYHKNLENGFWGLSNATQNLVNLYGQTGGNMTIDGHSRGGMITGNALDYLVKEGFFGQNTTVNLFGSAYNAQDAANLFP